MTSWRRLDQPTAASAPPSLSPAFYCETTKMESWMMDDKMELDELGIREFFGLRSVLVTGATGFVGKVLVEKLLRSCPSIAQIFLLIRPKRSKDVYARIAEITQSPLFDRLRSEKPDALAKMRPVAGDMTLPGLGIAPQDERLLVDTVSVVFHSAATVRFDEPFRDAVQQNLVGTMKMVDLCGKMSNLVAFVHVSTAYSNCNRLEIEERVYPCCIGPLQMLDLLKWMDDSTLASLTPKLLGKHPNTYTFTKALTENFLVENCPGLPVAIFRPSVVLASWNEPVPGWIDCLTGPTAVLAAAKKGLLRIVCSRKEVTADLIPVDVCANMMIAVAWITARHRTETPRVFHCTTGSINPVSLSQLVRDYNTFLSRESLANILWHPSISMTASRFYTKCYTTVVHLWVAYLADLASVAVGGKKKFVMYQRRVLNAVSKLEFFGHHQWKFSNENLWMLWNAMSKEEREVFGFDTRQLDWSRYFQIYFLGVKRYIFKEDVTKFPVSGRILRMISLLRFVGCIVGGYALGYVLLLSRRLPGFASKLRVGISNRLLHSVAFLRS